MTSSPAPAPPRPSVNPAVPAPMEESARRRSVTRLLEPLDQLAPTSPNLLRMPLGAGSSGTDTVLPRYVFVGPRGGGTPIRIGIFASIHGDEPESAHAVVEFLQHLDLHPELATGYILFFYPVCNPHGYENDTRHSRNGRDLNREFWRGSEEPEVLLLQEELTQQGLQGIVSLHSDDTSDGLYGFVRGILLSKHLLEPALAAGSRFLPRNGNPVIDGFPARNGIIQQGYPGILSPPTGIGPRPFEIVFETPAKAPAGLQRQAFQAALRSVLENYPRFISYGADL